MSARFRIKIDHGYREPVVVKDRRAPAYIRRFRTLRAAMLHIDNRVRAELGMGPRPDVERSEIRAAMSRLSSQAGLAALRAAKAYNNPGVHSHTYGEPSDGCPVCNPAVIS